MRFRLSTLLLNVVFLSTADLQVIIRFYWDYAISYKLFMLQWFSMMLYLENGHVIEGHSFTRMLQHLLPHLTQLLNCIVFSQQISDSPECFKLLVADECLSTLQFLKTQRQTVLVLTLLQGTCLLCSRKHHRISQHIAFECRISDSTSSAWSLQFSIASMAKGIVVGPLDNVLSQSSHSPHNVMTFRWFKDGL